MNARIVLCLAALAILGMASPADAQSHGQLKLPEFESLTGKASESVIVTLDSKLLGLAAAWLSEGDPEQAEAKKILTSLTGIYVRQFTFDSDYAYPKADLDAVRRQLAAPGWTRIVGARSNREHTDVDVFMLVDGDKVGGLAIIASEPREFVVVNIVGSIDLKQLHDLEGKFGVPAYGIEAPEKETPKKP